MLTPAEAEDNTCNAPHHTDEKRYEFVQTYKTECAWKTNWDRHFDDVTIASNDVEVTASTALAGAIASVKHGGKEYIGSGGHGSVFQWAIRSTPRATPQFTECYNPTQAGSVSDDEKATAPYHEDSTSWLAEFTKTGPSQFHANSRLAMFVPLGERSNYDGCDPSLQQPQRTPFVEGLSPYWLKNDVSVSGNVIKLGGTVDIEEDHGAQMSSTVVAYTQRDFSRQLSYRGNGQTIPFLVEDMDNRPYPVMRCTEKGDHCIGMYLQRSKYPAGTAYFYAHSKQSEPYNAMLGEYMLEVTWITRDREQHVEVEAYAAVGTQKQVMETLDRLKTELP